MQQPTTSVTTQAFRQAAEQHNHPAMMATLAADVVFHSPIVHQAYVGKDTVSPLLAAVLTTFTDFRYVAEYASADGAVLVFHARVGERDLDGVDILTFDAQGLVREFTVMVRPYSAATTLRELMAAKLQR